MSVAEEKQTTTYRCPACAGAMEEWDTICSQCRANLEAAVLEVRAEDYPVPARAATPKSERAPQHVEPDAEAVPVTREEPTVAEMEDMDLVPLAPLEDEKRPAPVRTAPPPPSTPVVVRPPAATPVIMDSVSALQPRNRWKHIIIAVVALIIAAAAAAWIWSYVVPARMETGNSVPGPSPATRNTR